MVNGNRGDTGMNMTLTEMKFSVHVALSIENQPYLPYFNLI
jgi:hypothetical protein